MKIKVKSFLRDGYECEVTITDKTMYELEREHTQAFRWEEKVIRLADEKSSTIIPIDKIQFIRLEEVDDD